MPKKQNSTLKTLVPVIIVVLILSSFFGLYFILKSNGINLFNLNIIVNNETIINQLNDDPSGSCTLDISPSLINLGDSVTGTIYDGDNTECVVFAKPQGTDDWKIVYSGKTNENGVLTDTFPIGVVGTFDFRAICGSCITNRESLAVRGSEPIEDGNNVGDVVDSGGGSGLTTGDGMVEIITLTPGDNDCTLGIRIDASWDSWSDGNYPEIDGECFNPNYQDWQSLYWSFQDSTALRWSDVMFAPPVKTLSADICPAIYTEDGTPWQIQMTPAFDDFDFPPPGCQVGYSYEYEIYNCECP